ncbi:hypothetical protein SAMN05444392_101665 [Seinonella peptonophila]|uniref:Uncharacterized protein n=2 Tax=Seinonella peptonophila TaxID=112248 RepID=A0A1M4TVI4_9BACL|nr:hypothetical protein SAMN05444392_101665 [Seinonella peptonophila]
MSDPVAELVFHLERMNYKEDEKQQFTNLWFQRMPEQYTRNAEQDIESYTMYEMVKSAIIDTVRIQQSFEQGLVTEAELDKQIQAFTVKFNRARAYWRKKPLLWTEVKQHFVEYNRSKEKTEKPLFLIKNEASNRLPIQQGSKSFKMFKYPSIQNASLSVDRYLKQFYGVHYL